MEDRRSETTGAQAKESRKHSKKQGPPINERVLVLGSRWVLVAPLETKEAMWAPMHCTDRTVSPADSRSA